MVIVRETSYKIEQNFGIANPGPGGSEGVGDFSKSRMSLDRSVAQLRVITSAGLGLSAPTIALSNVGLFRDGASLKIRGL